MRNLNKIFLIAIYTLFITPAFVFAVTPSCTPPFTTIEQAVICSGGTYGVIDTSDPNSANSFVNTVFDNGLTATDGGSGCTSMNIRPSIKFSCALSVNKDAYYYYQGQKGEKVTVTVSATNFVPEIDVSDANGGMEFFRNELKQKYLTVTKTLTYTGQYTFEVKTRYYTETKVGEPFTIILTSDKTNIQSDIRKDNLIEGKKYSVYDLKQNQSTTSRRFLTDAYVVGVYQEPPCPPDATYSCPISLSPNITIADNNLLGGLASDEYQTTLWIGQKYKGLFENERKYQFEVSVQNTSKTNIPQNNFNLVSVINSNGNKSTPITPAVSVSEGNLREGGFYKISELNKNLSTSTKTYKTEGYLVWAQNSDDCPICPKGATCDIFCPNGAEFSEINYLNKNPKWGEFSTSSMQAILVRESGVDNAGLLPLGYKYSMQVKVSNIGTKEKIKNYFEIINIAQIKDKPIKDLISTSTVTNDINPQTERISKKSFLLRFIDWIQKLF